MRGEHAVRDRRLLGIMNLVHLVKPTMVKVNLHEAKTHLSRLVDEAARGESFVIAKAGRPMVKVIPIDAPAEPQRM